MSLRPPYWTEADQAEADLVALELVDLWRSDAPREAKVKATDAAAEWVWRRRLVSRADYYRRRHIERAL